MKAPFQSDKNFMDFTRQKGLLIVLLSLALSGCATMHELMPEEKGPAILENGSPAEIEAAAITDAHADIAANRPRVAYAGGFAVWAVGIPNEHLHLVKQLPHVPLPCGCTHPLVGEAQIYAGAYNKVILDHLLKFNQTLSNSSSEL